MLGERLWLSLPHRLHAPQCSIVVKQLGLQTSSQHINHILSSIISVLSCGGGGVALKSTFVCTCHCWVTATNPSFLSYHFILRWPICVVVTTPLPLFFVSPLSFPDRYFYFFPTLSPKWKEHTFSEWFICIGPQFTFDIYFIFVVYLNG